MNLITAVKHKFFHVWFPNWTPDIALRYIPIVNDIKKRSDINSILDVGSGSLGITPYLRKKVIGIDVNFRGPHTSLLKKVRGTANKLPFNKNIFDASVCVDTLEHIPKPKRKKVIMELLRVTDKLVYIVVPCGGISEKEDHIIFSRNKRLNNQIDPYLFEHIKYGIPSDKEIIEYIPKKHDIKVYGLTNIYLHRLVLWAQLTNNRLLKFVSSVIFILLLPIFLKFNVTPVYRKLFIIAIDKKK